MMKYIQTALIYYADSGGKRGFSIFKWVFKQLVVLVWKIIHRKLVFSFKSKHAGGRLWFISGAFTALMFCLNQILSVKKNRSTSFKLPFSHLDVTLFPAVGTLIMIRYVLKASGNLGSAVNSILGTVLSLPVTR